MTVEISQTPEACNRIKEIGYASGKRIHIYGDVQLLIRPVC